jgi:uncharacterized protein YutE (UPF0331/DUF86 family)
VGDALTILAAKRESLTLDTYRNDREERDVDEREFETAIEACIDIGKMVLRERKVTVPATNAQVFHELVSRDILTEATGQRMAEAAGFRNILSHQYGNNIDDEDVFNFLANELPLFREYLEQIRDYLTDG